MSRALLLLPLVLLPLLFSGCSSPFAKFGKSKKQPQSVNYDKADGRIITHYDWKVQDVKLQADGSRRETSREVTGLQREVWYDAKGNARWEIISKGIQRVSETGWYADSEKHYVMEYRDGILVRSEVWHQNGLTDQVWTLEGGYRTTTSAWDPEGDLRYEAKLNDGVPVIQQYYYKNSKLHPTLRR